MKLHGHEPRLVWYIFSSHDSTSLAVLGLLYEVSRSHSVGHITLGRAPLDEGSAPRKDLYLTTNNTHKRRPGSRQDSNLQSQQASGHRPMPWTVRPLESAKYTVSNV